MNAPARPPKGDTKSVFFAELTALARSSRITIDRPKDSRHPSYPMARYPLDYGYLQDTRSVDGQGIDVFVGTSGREEVVGVVVVVDGLKREVESKLLLDCTPDEILTVVRFLTVELKLPSVLIEPDSG